MPLKNTNLQNTDSLSQDIDEIDLESTESKQQPVIETSPSASGEETSDFSGSDDDTGSVDLKNTADTDAVEHDFGIEISDDELWDDEGDLEEIPLFGEELDSSPETDPPEQPDPDLDNGPASGTAMEDGKDHEKSEEPVDDISSPAFAKPVQAESEEISADDADDSIEENSLTLWVVCGIATILLFVGTAVLWRMAVSPVEMHGRPAPVTDKNKRVVSGPSPDTGAAIHTGASVQTGSDGLETNPGPLGQVPVETIDLAPFLIPAQRFGELVFFKLQVELTVPDLSQKLQVVKKEAWVRDIIYTELKGIDISKGIQGNFLLKYRRPIKNNLNRELAPYNIRIKEVRLTGFLLD
ncbi:MAG TPA: hypothetical protein EYP57_04380 [Thermodesulfobacteriaceae bacterium]|nr:hypothetical protein [Thermodesulfobacteriaceae bacterium]